MAGTLTVSAKLSPFPFAAIAAAGYTQTAELVFSDVSQPSLELQGSTINDEAGIVQALSKAGGLAEDSAKVR